MARKIVDEAAAAVIAAAVRDAPQCIRRMRLKTLLAQFGLKVRAVARLPGIQAALEAAGLDVEPALMRAQRDDWIQLSGRSRGAADGWLGDVGTKSFANEKEVEIRFVVPLLERLGYDEEDRADGHVIQQISGSISRRMEADFVLFSSASRQVDDALMVVEAKRPGVRDFARYAAQARSYAMSVGAPLLLVTNGDEIRIYFYRGPLLAEVLLFSCGRNELPDMLERLKAVAGKAAAVALKADVAEAMHSVFLKRGLLHQ